MHSTINDRIAYLISDLKISSNKFADSIGVAHSTIHNIVKARKSEPSYSIIQKISSSYPTLSLTWLISGDGVMWKSDGGESSKADLDLEAIALAAELVKSSDAQKSRAGQLLQFYYKENKKLKDKLFILSSRSNKLFELLKDKFGLDI